MLGFVVLYVESAAVLTLYLYVTLLVPFVLDVGTGSFAVPPYVQSAIVTLAVPFALFIVNVPDLLPVKFVDVLFAVTVKFAVHAFVLLLYVTSYSLDAIVVLHIFTVGAGVFALPLYVCAAALTVALLKLYFAIVHVFVLLLVTLLPALH